MASASMALDAAEACFAFTQVAAHAKGKTSGLTPEGSSGYASVRAIEETMWLNFSVAGIT